MMRIGGITLGFSGGMGNYSTQHIDPRQTGSKPINRQGSSDRRSEQR